MCNLVMQEYIVPQESTGFSVTMTNARQLKGFLVIISQQCFSNDAGVL
jgi:hypothetical protein